MRKLDLDTVSSIFKPTAKRVNACPGKLYRTKDWVGTEAWLVRIAGPEFIQGIDSAEGNILDRTNKPVTDELVEALINSALENRKEYAPAEILNHIKWVFGNICGIYLRTEKDVKALVDCYNLALFAKLPATVSLWVRHSESPILVATPDLGGLDTIVGVLMPIKEAE